MTEEKTEPSKKITDKELTGMIDSAFETLGPYLKKQEKKQKDSKNDELISKAGLKIDDSVETDSEAESIGPDVDFGGFIKNLLLVLNPFLRKSGVTPLEVEELEELKNSIMPLINPKMIESVQKMANTMKGISGLVKIGVVAAALWKIIAPRFSELRKLFKQKKEKELYEETNE